ncbi:MAG: hypothetical protein GF416_05440 [Candidatus Altiarchaeales archaeon]|nr:hypothetical protein [Candidatus Altiarchaeales archaeon]
MGRRKLTITAFFMLLLAGFSSAAYIRIDVAVEPISVISAGSQDLKATFTNLGDEPAYDVQASLLLPDGFQAQPVFIGLLQPNTPSTQAFSISIDESNIPGTYPIVVKTHYADANAYPFTTVYPFVVHYKQPAPTKVRGLVKEVSLPPEKKRDLVLEVTNLDAKPQTVSVRLYLPDEIVADQYETEISLDAQGTGSVSIPIKAFGALPGSTYVVFASLEYEEAGLHYSILSGGMVKVVEEEEEETIEYLPMAALILLVGMFLYMQVKK